MTPPVRHVLCDRLFDGVRVRRGPVRLDLAGGRIEAVVEGDAAIASASGPRIDARGDTVLPGLIDAHVHLPRRGMFEAEEPPSIRAIAGNLRRVLSAGVTTVGDMGCTPGLIGALRAHTGRDPLAGPAIRAAGPIVTAPRGYPLDWMPPLLVRAGAAVACDGEAAARAVVARLAQAGADHVKIGIMHRTYGDRPVPALDAATARAIVAEAHTQGLRVLAHAHSVADYRVALDAGVDALMHSSFEPLPRELVARVRGAGIPVCPTLFLFGAVCRGAEERWDRDPARRSGLDPAVVGSWRRFADAYEAAGDVLPPGLAGGLPKARAMEGARIAAANLALLADAGVPIAFGDDTPYGYATLAAPRAELEAMHRAGLSVEACLRAATHEAARLLGLVDRGALAPGQRADLLVLAGDATRDLAALDRPRAVLAQGHLVGAPGPLRTSRTMLAVARGLAATAVDALGFRPPSR